MRLPVLSSLAFLSTVAAAAAQTPAPDGAAVFKQSCATCHTAAPADRAPSDRALREMTPDAIRTASSKWLGRLVLTVIMGFLIISFAIWGIGDIFRGATSRTIATVGSESIGAEEFRNNFNRELQRVQQQTRRPVTTDHVESLRRTFVRGQPITLETVRATAG